MSLDQQFVNDLDVAVPDYILSEITQVEFTVMGRKTTVCLITVDNGFEIIGTSACVNPASFNRRLGAKLAFENALDKLEELDAYLRQSRAPVEKQEVLLD